MSTRVPVSLPDVELWAINNLPTTVIGVGTVKVVNRLPQSLSNGSNTVLVSASIGPAVTPITYSGFLTLQAWCKTTHGAFDLHKSNLLASELISWVIGNAGKNGSTITDATLVSLNRVEDPLDTGFVYSEAVLGIEVRS